MSGRSRRSAWLFWLATILIVAGSVAAWGRPVYQFVADQEQVRGWVGQLGPYGPLGLVLLEVAQILLAPLPGQAVGLVSGYLYGPWWGTLYAMAGLLAGSLLSFLLARHFGRPLLRRLAGESVLARLDELARRGGTLFFLLIWLVPFTPDDVVCFAAGLTPISTGQFLLLVTLGRLPGVLVYTWVGANATRLNPTWWAIGIGCLAVLAVGVWRWGKPLEGCILQLIERLAGYRRT